MRKVNGNAKRILDILTFGVDSENTHKRLDNASGTFMPVSVNWIGKIDIGQIFSVAHYGEQNGDLMADPDVEFLKGTDGNYYPLSIRQDYLGSYRTAVNIEGSKVVSFFPREQKDIAVFCGMWMKNIEQQQAIEIDGKYFTVLQSAKNVLANGEENGTKLLVKKMSGKKLFLVTSNYVAGETVYSTPVGCPAETKLVTV